MRTLALMCLLLAVMVVAPAEAQPGTVIDHQEISDTAGEFYGGLGDGELFGSSVAWLGDLDGDGVDDLAVGVPLDDQAEGGSAE